MSSELDFHGIAMDANNVQMLAAFWCAAAYYEVEDANYPYVAVLRGRRPSLPRIIILGVPESKIAKNRVHIEFKSSNLQSELTRMVALGATLVAEREFGDTRWIVMRDPEGNEFCLVDPH